MNVPNVNELYTLNGYNGKFYFMCINHNFYVMRINHNFKNNAVKTGEDFGRDIIPDVKYPIQKWLEDRRSLLPVKLQQDCMLES